MSTKELQEIKFSEKELKNKAAITLPENATVKIYDAAIDVSENTLDIGELLNVETRLPGEKKSQPASQLSNIAEVNKIMAVGDQLVSMNKKYKEEYLVRGNQALYEMLSGIYDLALHIEKSDYKEKVLSIMRKTLKDNDIKTQSNTPTMTTLIKYVVRSDRQTAANYSRVLSVAMDDGVPPKELAEYISRRGGISLIHEIEAKAMAKKLGSEQSRDRIELIRHLFQLSGLVSKKSFKFDGHLMTHNPEKNTSAETGTFCFFMTVWDEDTKEYKVVGAHDLGKTYEDAVLKILTRGSANNLNSIKERLNQWRETIISRKLLSDGWINIIKNQIAREQEENKAQEKKSINESK
jgi:hypothetical protein